MQQLILAAKPVVERLRGQLEEKVQGYRQPVVLAIVLVGEDVASHVYKNQLVKLAEKLGAMTDVRCLPQEAETGAVLSLIRELNENGNITGILTMMPLPRQVDGIEVGKAIQPDKDVDCQNPLNAGLLYMGRNPWAPCTPRAVMETLRHYGIPVAGRHAAVIGRSNVVGKPLANLLLAENATVTVCHSKTSDLAKITRQADIVVAGVGVPGFVQADMLKEGAVLIDVGINQMDAGIVGDASPEACQKAGAYTPVPGGIGSISSMMVMETLLRNIKS